MLPTEVESPRVRMNAHFRRVLQGLLTNAERDVRLARAGGDGHEIAKARARLDTLGAVLETYAASHLIGYGERPWPREVGE